MMSSRINLIRKKGLRVYGLEKDDAKDFVL